MKVFLATGILLVCAYTVSSAALPRPKRHEKVEIEEDKRDELVDRMNNARREFAKAGKIGNMRRVEWDDALEKTVPHFDCGRKMPIEIEEKVKEFEKKPTEDNLLNLMDSVAAKTTLSCLHPKQTEVACIVMKCKNPQDPATVTGILNCICGPEGQMSKSDIKEGDPGSQCDDDEKDGLCVDGSSNLFGIGIILNLISFYLFASFVF